MYLVQDPEHLVRVMSTNPSYLQSSVDGRVANLRDWGIPLGRRFRALKLWFLLRAHGLEALRDMIRNHVRWSEGLAARLAEVPGFEIVTEPMLSLFTFRHRACDDSLTDEHNLALVDAINDGGTIYLTQTRVDGRVAIRFQTGQFETTQSDVDIAFDVIVATAKRLNGHG
jgi:aromatic-L-amino-acid decarboxylase